MFTIRTFVIAVSVVGLLTGTGLGALVGHFSGDAAVSITAIVGGVIGTATLGCCAGIITIVQQCMHPDKTPRAAERELIDRAVAETKDVELAATALNPSVDTLKEAVNEGGTLINDLKEETEEASNIASQFHTQTNGISNNSANITKALYDGRATTEAHEQALPVYQKFLDTQKEKQAAQVYRNTELSAQEDALFSPQSTATMIDTLEGAIPADEQPSIQLALKKEWADNDSIHSEDFPDANLLRAIRARDAAHSMRDPERDSKDNPTGNKSPSMHH